MSVHEELDADIIHEALWGDPPRSARAFARVYDHYEPLVRYVVARASHRARYDHRVDELRQDVWCRLLESNRKLLRYYKPECGSFRNFIARLAYQQALHAAHKDRRQSAADGYPAPAVDDLEDPGTSAFAATMIQGDLYAKLMERARDELDELDHIVLREIYLNLRRARAVAEEHGLSEGRVYKRHERLKKKLAAWARELLQPARAPLPAQAPLAMLAVVLTALASPDSVDPPPPDSLTSSTRTEA